jgi:hypothetical protein
MVQPSPTGCLPRLLLSDNSIDDHHSLRAFLAYEMGVTSEERAVIGCENIPFAFMILTFYFFGGRVYCFPTGLPLCTTRGISGIEYANAIAWVGRKRAIQ